MALLDAALRTRGQTAGKQLWPVFRDLQLKIALPNQIAVINTFTKIVRPKKNGPSDDDGTGLVTPLGSTIAYREYVSFGGLVGIAAQASPGDLLPDALTGLFTHITYLGKRGSFLQLLAPPAVVDDADLDIETGWVMLTRDQTSFSIGGTLQMLDDCGPKMTFEHADIYSGKRITLGKERILRHVVLPHQLTRSSRGFCLYERIV
ncbi:MAG TPA: hypothetical protein VFU22_25015 [Roseiflexaceae bacterium]|nr:hypothetical protein [Roseiflexaceae bacterium]